MRPIEQAWRLLKGEYGPTDEEIPNLADFEQWYNRHYKTTPQLAYGSGDVEDHLNLYYQKYYNPMSMDERITQATKDALPEVVRNYPNLSRFKQAPVFIERDEDNSLGRHLKNNSEMGVVNLLAADAHKVADEPFQEMKRTMQHELGHGIIDNLLAHYDEYEEEGVDIPQTLRNVSDWHDDDEEGLVEELPHSIYDKDLDRSRWNTIDDYYKTTGEPMDLAWRLLKARGEPKKREEMRQIADTFHDESEVNHAQRVKQFLQATPYVKDKVSQITGKPSSKYKNVPIEAKETKDDEDFRFEGGKATVPFQVMDRPFDVGNPQFATQMGDARNPNNPNYKEFFDTGKIPDYDERKTRRMNRQAEIDRAWADLDDTLFGEAGE